MNLFKRKKLPVFSIPLTAIDKRTLARVGDKLDEDLLQEVAAMSPHAQSPYFLVKDTPVYAHLQLLLEKEQYSFVAENGPRRKYILDLLGNLSFNQLVFKELEWMARYDYYYHHTLAVSLLVSRLAYDFFSEYQWAHRATSSALIYDFGITRVPAEILNKVSRLTEEEKNIIQEHPLYSYLLATYYLGDYRRIDALVAYEHHEDLIGTGYPRGIIQDNIIAQIVKVCDFYDALISARPFRPAYSPACALKAIGKEVEKGTMSQLAYDLLVSYHQNVRESVTVG